MISPDKAMDTLRKHMLVDGFDVLIDFDKSRGNTIVDARDGRSYLDMFSMVASQPLGLNHPALTDETFVRRLGRAAIHNTTNSDIYNTDVAEFVHTFMTLAAPSSMKHLFLVAGGTLGVENALKIAFDWKVRKNFRKGYKEEKGHQVLHFKECFHGRSGYTLSLTNTDPSKTKYYPKFDWPRIVNPKIAFPLEGQSLRDVERTEAEALAQIKQALHERRDDIAALIIEPIQGEGGDNHFRAEFFRALRQVCDESEVFFIVDEVQTGIALTGRMWAYQHFGIEPDAIAFGKKTQVCGCLVSSRVDEVENNAFVESSRINSTWGGNTVDMVRSSQYLKVIAQEKLVERAAAVGAASLERVRSLQTEVPGVFTNARGRGMMMAVDLGDPSARPALLRKATEMGLLILPTGSRGIRFRPSLITTQAEIEKAVEILARSAREVGAGKASVAV
ncbi:MAG TPA: L-lysine 6-transaminase [Candidatus Polarisedimenticolia bacterium]|nr:L-lysine 6-transaminase [Candidatus Polarisedimenticolia bacterium]